MKKPVEIANAMRRGEIECMPVGLLTQECVVRVNQAAVKSKHRHATVARSTCMFMSKYGDEINRTIVREFGKDSAEADDSHELLDVCRRTRCTGGVSALPDWRASGDVQP
jgi:hypothetical protein